LLPERQRTALVLCHFDGLSNQDAAAVLEVSVDALESLLSRARRTLKTTLLPLLETDEARPCPTK
jgi:RNA polymerase sigma-70 factor (ECF subfamily)